MTINSENEVLTKGEAEGERAKAKSEIITSTLYHFVQSMTAKAVNVIHAKRNKIKHKAKRFHHHESMISVHTDISAWGTLLAIFLFCVYALLVSCVTTNI